MTIIRKWNSISLIIRILCGLAVGVILGLLIPNATGISVLGQLFVGALKAVAPILVLVLVASSLANAKGGHAKKFRTVIILYLFSTMLAAVIAVIANFMFPTFIPLEGVTASEEYVAPSGMSEVIVNLLTNVVANPIDALLNANYIGILFWAVILGLALKRSSDSTKRFLDDLADAISKIVRGIISCAPFGILGLVFNSVSTSGIDIFKTYGHLVAVLVCTMLFIAFVVNPLIVGLLLRHNPYPLIWKCIRTSGITAFFTRSSAANIPVNMELCEELGLDEDMYSVSIPLGATINMNPAHGNRPQFRSSILRMRRFRRCRWIASAGSTWVLPLRRCSGCCHGDCRRRFYHQCDSGFHGNCSELIRRCDIHCDCRIQGMEKRGKKTPSLIKTMIIQ